MVDIDWFLKRSRDHVDLAEKWLAQTLIFEFDMINIRAAMLAAWATWNIINTLQSAGLVLTDSQSAEFDALKTKLAEYRRYLPEGIEKHET